MDQKQRAALEAVKLVESGMLLGLGTGSTAERFLAALANELKKGALGGIRGVPTSQRSQRLAQELGIPTAVPEEGLSIDLTIDGADEIDPSLHLIKGLGGALLREKIVAQQSKRLVIIADESKCVDRLGTRTPVPVEVDPFLHGCHSDFFRDLGAEPTLRRSESGQVFITDGGNVIYDCHFGRIEDPIDLEEKLRARAGVVGTGLFIGMAALAIIGTGDGVKHVARGRR
jgi:ribose 5-phosphate isomerase A